MKNRFKLFCFLLIFLLFLAFLYFQKKKYVVRIKTNDIRKELISLGKKYKLEWRSTEITDDNNIKANYKDIEIIFSTSKNLEKEVASLQKILKSSTIESGAHEIDFRFNKVVVR